MRVTLFSSFLVLALLLTGCGQTATTTKDASTTSAPAADSNAAGKKLAEEICVRCHPYDRVTGHNADKAGWAETVKKMKGYGAQISSEEEEAIVEYLAEAQPAK